MIKEIQMHLSHELVKYYVFAQSEDTKSMTTIIQLFMKIFKEEIFILENVGNHSTRWQRRLLILFNWYTIEIPLCEEKILFYLGKSIVFFFH